MRILAPGGLALLAVALLAAAWPEPRLPPAGFSQRRAAAQAALEERFLRIPSPGRIRETHRILTSEPHVAGSARDRELAGFMRDRFRECGLEDVATTTHEVLLPRPLETAVEIVAPIKWRAPMREEPLDREHHAPGAADAIGPPYHAYSASGDVTAPIVFAGRGEPEDYEWLASRQIDVRGKIVLVRYSVPYSYRGAKVLTAQQKGAVAIVIYSDPADDGSGSGKVYPHGPWGPDSRIQRGGVSYDFFVPGDPLTPGWPSSPGAKRLDRSEVRTLPSIVSVPLSASDARVILEAMGGPQVPEAWRGALPIPYRAGSGSVVLRVRARSDDAVRPVWTVTGSIRGAELPDQTVIAGNHRDAWSYGGVDPSSGTAALVELACSLGELTRNGWRPRRSILFASWDAEEFGLTSSTEWSEEREAWLRRNAVAYLNVDAAVAGSNLDLTAVPALNVLLEQVAQKVRDPASGLTLAARSRDRRGGAGSLINNRIGGGSDYTVFLNFLGVPIADLSFDGPYGVYHSIYDTHRWVSTNADPEFRYHAALVHLWGLTAVRLADADVLPLDYLPYADRLVEFVAEVGRAWVGLPGERRVSPMLDVESAIADLRVAALEFNRRRQRALEAEGTGERQRLDEQIMATERALLDPEGIPGRPWFRHSVFAPKFSYAPAVLPGIAEAVEASDNDRAVRQARRLADALRRAAAALSRPAN
jgi:N-acetylated-alpha-linked acidic dipeptidase